MKNADKDDQPGYSTKYPWRISADEDGRVTFYGALFLLFLMGCIAAYAIATTHP